MTNFGDLIAKHADLPVDDQKKMGKAVGGDMKHKHEAFLKTLIDLLDRGEIRASDPQSMIKKDVYDKLSDEWKDAVTLALSNIAEQVRLIEQFYRSDKTPNSSPHLETMIEHLWVMKQRIETHHDAFKF